MAAVIRRKSEHRTDFEIYSILKTAFDAESTDFAISIDGEDLYTSAEVLIMMINRYSDYIYSVSDIFASSAGNHFVNEWKLYVSRMGENLLRAYQALYAEYDPISNYDMTEQGADGKKIDKTTVETTPTGTTTNTSELSRAGLDSSTPVLSDKTETTTSFDEAKTTTTDTPDNTLTAAFGDDTLTGHEVTEHRLSRSGNIGVTTSQQMIGSELELRRTDLLGEFVTGFAKQTLYYVG